MTTYEITAWEFKAGTEEAETYIVMIDGKDGPIFATLEEAQEWVGDDKMQSEAP